MKGKSNSIVFLVKTVLFSFLLIAGVFALSLFFSQFEKEDPDGISADADVDLRPVVILDPGHGGMDSGAVSVLGDEEKHINLALAKKLGAFLEEAGIRVIYTRTEDEMLSSDKTTSRKMGDLMGRAEIAAQNEGAVFVSIHMNTLPIEKYKGLQVFYSEHHSSSKPLALQIQNDARTLLQPENKREIKNPKGSIYILDRITSPAVLVECGFLSNHEEARLLTDEEYQNRLAFVLSRSLSTFLLQKGSLE